MRGYKIIGFREELLNAPQFNGKPNLAVEDGFHEESLNFWRTLGVLYDVWTIGITTVACCPSHLYSISRRNLD
ncbi:hypothetical protein Nepgr_011903 [Nepenthes gracilis]|uniref:Uncharacterized protein n=1 Tax=Nepenthes gracilis TaxID=150966 RepID=A0AAD3XMD6_NEPGR|nr:hypothetical protein Nepgr_011903 [Nepenthes gracilis]